MIVINELPTRAVPCMRYSGEVANPQPDAASVLKSLVIKTEGGHDGQRVEQFATRVGRPLYLAWLIALRYLKSSDGLTFMLL
jgi:hypothetical protein